MESCRALLCLEKFYHASHVKSLNLRTIINIIIGIIIIIISSCVGEFHMLSLTAYTNPNSRRGGGH